MNSRELVLGTLQHQDVDRIPVYFGGTSTFLTDEAYDRLRQHFGLEGEVDPYRKGHTGTIYDDRILEKLGADVRFVVFNLQNYGVREFVSEDRIIDEWGIPIVRVGGMWSRMDPPLTDASYDDVAKHRFHVPSLDERNRGLREHARYLAEETDYAVVARSPHSASFLELGCWLMGAEDFFVDLVTQEDACELLLDKICETQMAYYEVFLKEVGEYVDIVETSEDYGTQKSLFISPSTYREMIMPRKLKIHEVIHRYAPQAKIFHHSCGAIRQLLPDLIDTGIDIIHPIQPGLPGMDPDELKKEFGDRICFCGGIDMQHAINGTPEDVDREVLRCKKALGKSGGYFYSTSNHIQIDTPVENVLRLFEDFQKL
ncbi:MAG: hypothetical protein IJX90_09720 [Blautia sp.]|nr:hypothetical protein [Blautia sp.]